MLTQSETIAAADLATTVSNVWTDQLGAARMITRPSDEAIQWRWDTAEAFGATAPNENPSGLGSFTFNQRLPGQLFDAETGLLQNWHREYNPRIGRYVQSDPIGLQGGINTFAYVISNPLINTDRLGLGPWDKLYGLPKDFWKWLHKEEGGELMKAYKDPKTGQIPKEDARQLYDQWKNNKDRGFVDPTLLEGLIPWVLTPSAIASSSMWGPGTIYPTARDYDNSKIFR